jgi:hypothetical protein
MTGNKTKRDFLCKEEISFSLRRPCSMSACSNDSGFTALNFYTYINYPEEVCSMRSSNANPLPSVRTHCKKRFAVFPFPDLMSLTKLSLAGNNSIIW